MAQIDIKNATIFISDGGAGSAMKQMEITIGEGNFQWTENREVEYTLDRGRLDEVRLGDETPMEVSFDATWEKVSADTGASSGEITPVDAVKGINSASNWVSTDSDPCRPYCVNIGMIHEPACGSEGKETVMFPDFRYESIDFDLRNGTISVSGKCNALEPTIVAGD